MPFALNSIAEFISFIYIKSFENAHLLVHCSIKCYLSVVKLIVNSTRALNVNEMNTCRVCCSYSLHQNDDTNSVRARDMHTDNCLFIHLLLCCLFASLNLGRKLRPLNYIPSPFHSQTHAHKYSSTIFVNILRYSAPVCHLLH